MMKGDTYVGYYVSLYFQTAMGSGFLTLFAAFTQLQIGFCSYIAAAAKDFNGIFHRMDKYVAKKPKKGELRLHGNEIKESMIETIDLHGEILR